MGGAAQRLAQLRAKGVDWSRNRNFHLFAEAGNGAALRLKRQIDALRDAIIDADSRGEVTLTAQTARGCQRVQLEMPAMSARLTLFLEPEAIRELARTPRVAQLLRQAGVDQTLLSP